ncbi:hypothetical protein MNBD_GAMMA03-671 [hydrothermal vent metagenome]|uniref:Uncharacterized protein n=1 Tax=hydrothermal vent metagenome TaxID=652676 RepID=A0A3B0W5I5_9ZZZZ
MNLIKRFLIMAILAQAFISNAAIAKDIVIAISPYDEVGEPVIYKAKAIVLIQFAVTQQAGDRIIFIDGYNVQPIATIAIPEDKKYISAKARINVNRKAVAALLEFYANIIQPNREGHPSVNQAVKLPQLLRFAAQNYKSSQPLDVIILGSALYDDQGEFSMAKGHFPSDGHLSQSRAVTPFGTKDVNGLFHGLRVHIRFKDKLLENDRLSYFIHRFWTLFIEQEKQGGELVSFSSSKSVFERVKSGASAPEHNYELIKSDKLEMNQLQPIEVKKQSIFERSLSDTPLTKASINSASNLELGITWRCIKCDLDIYSSPFPNAPVLSYLNKNSSHGKYEKDFLQAPNINGLETISYKIQTELSMVVVAINFYSGSAPEGATGVIRISVDNQTYASNFIIKATKGNGGKGVKAILDSRHSNMPETIIIDLLEVVKTGTLQ